MWQTSARLLKLLSLLQARAGWTGAELARRLGVSTRTIRYDIGKLRDLGYPVEATPGAAGGYRLGAGAALPPLLLDDEEAVAVAVSLRAAAGGTVAGLPEASVRALAKLEQVLPARVRPRVRALHGAIAPLGTGGPSVDPTTLTAIAAACRDHHRLRLRYRSHDGTESAREVEPYRLVHTGRRWYLVAWDLGRGDWRTFRVDRLTVRIPHGPRFVPRGEPPADLVPRGVAAALSRHRARVVVHAPADAVAGHLPPCVRVTPLGEDRCEVAATGDTPLQLALNVLMLDLDVDVDGPPELLAVFARLHARLQRQLRRPAVACPPASDTGAKRRSR
jgi:predicted DNA-binding transcriptional regulator YafY